MNAQIKTNHQQDALDRLAKIGARVKITRSNTKRAPWDDNQPRNHYKVKLTNKEFKVYTFDFFDSVSAFEKGETPDAYGVLACLGWHDCGTFGDFRNDYGYDNSREAKKIYNAVKHEWKNLGRLFSAEEIEILAEIQ